MSGTISGGKAAAKTNKERHGEDFYCLIGAKGGKVGRTGGFAQTKACTCDIIRFEHTIAMCAGTKGGRISKRNRAI